MRVRRLPFIVTSSPRPRNTASTTRRNSFLFLKRKTVISAPSSPISVTTLMLDCKMSRK